LSQLAARSVLGVVTPTRREQVATVVKICADADAPISLYPVSSGMNWGLGSSTPAASDCLLLDLSRLSRCLALDVRSGVAAIEAGVTQGQLSRALRRSPFIVNLTASSGATSIVGNALDRGVGFYRQRTDDIDAVEAVLGSGDTVLCGGQAPLASSLEDRGSGLAFGPDLHALFFQSNFGIVTAARVRLIRRPADLSIYRITAPGGQFPRLVEWAAGLQRLEIATGVCRVYHASSRGAYEGRAARVAAAYVCVSGPTRIAAAKRALLRELARAGRGIVVSRVTDRAGETPLDRVVRSCFQGDPSYNDAMIEATFGVSPKRLDAESPIGWLTFLPMLPVDVRVLTWATAEVRRIARRYDVEAHATANVLPSASIDFVVGLRFQRAAVRSASVAAAFDALHDAFAAKGFAPYRLAIDKMAWGMGRHSRRSYVDLLARLKRACDPASIVAPGRYVPSTVEPFMHGTPRGAASTGT
jgi:4-cresol dehydrogenase (hydroxylating)